MEGRKRGEGEARRGGSEDDGQEVRGRGFKTLAVRERLVVGSYRGS